MIGMAAAATIMVGFAAIVLMLDLFSPDDVTDLNGRLVYCAPLLLVPAFWTILSVGRLARYRFFNPQDIDGAGLSKASEGAKVLQAVLQNTLEQSVIAAIVYVAAGITLPVSWLPLAPTATILFFIGRILFVAGYSSGATSRSVGFALTFYPSVALFVATAIGAVY